MSQSQDQRWMALALSLGRRGLGACWPNPSVGCVIVRDGRILARARTEPGGSGKSHAEVRALAAAGDVRGATVYVTLEPCSHTGSTPPCARALIEAGVARVVVACGDPHPSVNGRGFAMLRDAGIEVVTGVLETEALRDHAGFLNRVTKGRPMVTLKLATSLDGRIATASGDSQWITGPDARAMVHLQRSQHDAVMVGSGTARSDDPSLTVRGLGIRRQPLRVVLDSRLRTPPDGNLGRTARDVPVWMCHTARAPAERQAAWAQTGARLISCPTHPSGHLDLAQTLQALGREGLTRIFCEGGGQLAASLLQEDCVDQMITFQAGVALGAEGLPSLGPLGLSHLTEARRFALAETRQIGADTMSVWV